MQSFPVESSNDENKKQHSKRKISLEIEQAYK